MNKERNNKSHRGDNGSSRQDEIMEARDHQNKTLYQFTNSSSNFQSIEDMKRCHSPDQTRLQEALFNIDDQPNKRLENSPYKMQIKEEMSEERVNGLLMMTNKKVPIFHNQGQTNETPRKEYKNCKHLMDEFNHQSVLCLERFISQQKQLQQRVLSQLNGGQLHKAQKKKSDKLINDMRRRMTQQDKLLINSQRLNRQLQRENNDLKQEIQRLQEVHVDGKSRWCAQIEEMKEIENDYRMKIQILKQTVSSLQKQISIINNQKSKLMEQVSKTNMQLLQQTSILCQKNQRIHEMQQQQQQMENEIQERRNQLCERRTTMDQQNISFDTQIRELQAQHLQEIQHIKRQKNQEIKQLKMQLQQAKRYNEQIIKQLKTDFYLLSQEYKDHDYYFDSLHSGHDLAQGYRIQLLQMDLKLYKLNIENQNLRKDLFETQNQLLNAKGLHFNQLNQSVSN